MTDFYLPHFYNLPPAVLLSIFSFNRLQSLFDFPPNGMHVLATVVTIIPAVTAATYFFQQYQARREVSVRQGLFILVAVQLLSALLPGLLR